MSLKDGLRGNRVYLIISIFIIIVIFLTFIFSNTYIYPAYVPSEVLDGWEEDESEKIISSELFGLQSQRSFTYINNNSNYTANLTVTTMKNFFMINENELWNIVKDTITKKASKLDIDLKIDVSGKRLLKNGHRSRYIIYDSTDNSTGVLKQIKIIGEVWNCDESSTSIICIGYANITDHVNNNPEINLEYWGKIISDSYGTFAQIYQNPIYFDNFYDSEGLIFNVKCH